MRKIILALSCGAFAILPARADTILAPGKPAGVQQAQLNSATAIYGSVLLVGGILFAIIGTTGNPASSTTATN